MGYMHEHKRTTKVSWTRFERDTRRLAAKIGFAAVKPGLILGINRGGAISAVLLSHFLGARDMLTFTIQMTLDNGPNAPRGRPTIVGAEIFPNLAGRCVLLVDDAVGSGRTYDYARAAIAPFRPRSLYTAATIWNTEMHKQCPADFYGGKTCGWVLFPWERP